MPLLALIRQTVAQFVIPECYIPMVSKLVHDGVIAGHTGKYLTLIAARTNNFWTMMHIGIDAYVS